MNYPVRININLVSLENQKPTSQNECYVELRDDCVIYHNDFNADEPKDADDKDLGWDNVYNFFETIAKRENVAGIEKSYIQKTKRWAAYIIVNGFSSDIRLYFRSKASMEEVYDQLKEWMLTTPVELQ